MIEITGIIHCQRLKFLILILRQSLNSIRLSLEAFLKFKYGRYLPTLDGTFGQIIAELEKKTSCVLLILVREKLLKI